MSTFNAVHLAKRPTSDIIPGETFEVKVHPTPKETDLKDGQVIFQSNYLSLDPAMRGWLKDARSYVPPVKIGEIMRGAAVGKVVGSKSSKFPVGSYATATCGWAELAVVSDKYVEKVELPSNASIADSLGILGTHMDCRSLCGYLETILRPRFPITSSGDLIKTGLSAPRSRLQPINRTPLFKISDNSHGFALTTQGLTGLTAYFGILDVGQVKAGDFVVVSGAAGATGSVVGQICKIKGARVLGLAGTDDKCAWLINELGFDAALNYKEQNFPKNFRDATKGLIDIFFDNVGGDILDMALGRAKPHSRFVMCGGISQYNAAEAKGPKNYMMIVAMRIRMQGFIVTDYESQFVEARRELAQWMSEGKIKGKLHIVRGGLEKAEQALVDLYKGVNTGKLLVEIKPDADTKSKL
ncbi:NADP-dependent leukotriene B4 12-hydroxydehydrogenase [Pseudovirgaria hyperparasitica]|uniref:NADP-dependent leukotriene B4 12-hydroxydehydrogenase n=1 Tax=Pseudovirgaria hyperparasitica TaxID=470096 RepID=A0A6A6WB06_9PEZI|nr:NADP-dependent leukotriene B4 12-hydroxydehydrogenase [Pseudovirgaria hyperparasitica]KAF2759016.1 NADP-dependent leukotriene B4 12-hydroxydehydrogenase [Pseudovirgaria hyperparasitica]